jgi:hypothetical protein
VEHLDPITATTPDWDAFIASLDPERLEKERFGRPGEAERFGSPGWRRMVAEHDARRFAYYRVPARITDWELELMLAEVSEWDRRFNNSLTPTHIRIALHAMNNPKRSTAA